MPQLDAVARGLVAHVSAYEELALDAALHGGRERRVPGAARAPARSGRRGSSRDARPNCCSTRTGRTSHGPLSSRRRGELEDGARSPRRSRGIRSRSSAARARTRTAGVRTAPGGIGRWFSAAGLGRAGRTRRVLPLRRRHRLRHRRARRRGDAAGGCVSDRRQRHVRAAARGERRCRRGGGRLRRGHQLCRSGRGGRMARYPSSAGRPATGAAADARPRRAFHAARGEDGRGGRQRSTEVVRAHFGCRPGKSARPCLRRLRVAPRRARASGGERGRARATRSRERLSTARRRDRADGGARVGDLGVESADVVLGGGMIRDGTGRLSSGGRADAAGAPASPADDPPVLGAALAALDAAVRGQAGEEALGEELRGR